MLNNSGPGESTSITIFLRVFRHENARRVPVVFNDVGMLLDGESPPFDVHIFIKDTRIVMYLSMTDEKRAPVLVLNYEIPMVQI